MLAAMLLSSGIQSAIACGDTPYIGEVCTFAMDWCPHGFVEANGQSLPINNNSALYSLIGVTYGGDAKTVFNVPDLRGRSIVHHGQAPGLSPITTGQSRGAESVMLTETQVPLIQHTHTSSSAPVSLPVAVDIPAQSVSVSGSLKIASSTATGLQNVQPNAVLAKGGGQASIYAASTTVADTNIGPEQTFTGSTTATTVNTSASGPVDVAINPSTSHPATARTPTIPPQLAMTHCIATSGTYPPKN